MGQNGEQQQQVPPGGRLIDKDGKWAHVQVCVLGALTDTPVACWGLRCCRTAALGTRRGVQLGCRWCCRS